jgi:thiol-disulfide isomerase/thioredoxin
MKWILGTPALVLALALNACGKAPGGGEVRAAPSFDLPALGGGRVTLASLKGKVTVIDFWATWCGPCITEIPEYKKFSARNQSRGVEVVGIVLESGEPQEIQDFVNEHRMTYRQLLGDEAVQDAFGANMGLPTTFVVDAQGLIRAKILGSPPGKFEELQKAVDAALAAR